jgi:excisionase family DNA binding protein
VLVVPHHLARRRPHARRIRPPGIEKMTLNSSRRRLTSGICVPAQRHSLASSPIAFVDLLRRTLPHCCAPLVRCEFYAPNGPKGSLVGRRAAADHAARETSMNSASSPLKGRLRTLQGVLRERLPQIEATSKTGCRMRTIVEQLAQEGLHTTLGDFRDSAAMSRAAEPLAAFVDLIADAVAERLKEHRSAPAESASVSVASDSPEWLTMVQAAARLGVTRKSLESWRSTGCAPPAVRIGRSVRFNARDLDAWARTNPQIVSPKRRRQPTSAASVVSASQTAPTPANRNRPQIAGQEHHEAD